jgi:BirA family biotin operon repressor/biotin-[acetyl-CoA-carboxylase] ligase
MKTHLHSFIRLEQVDSTNMFVEELINSNNDLQEHLVVNTKFQTQGQGQVGNSWYSSKSKNLLFSYLLAPQFLKPSDQFRLNIIISLAIVDFLQKYCKQKERIRIKWPNDIYIDDKKIAGVLIRLFIQNQKIKYAIIGVGININESSFPGNIPNPTSLSLETREDYDPDELLSNVTMLIYKHYEQLKKITWEQLESSYLKLLYQYDMCARYRYKGELISARIIGLTEYGQLRLLLPDSKTITCDMQTIKYVIG